MRDWLSTQGLALPGKRIAMMTQKRLRNQEVSERKQVGDAASMMSEDVGRQFGHEKDFGQL
jgi:hypothetical protein